MLQKIRIIQIVLGALPQFRRPLVDIPDLNVAADRPAEDAKTERTGDGDARITSLGKQMSSE